MTLKTFTFAVTAPSAYPDATNTGVPVGTVLTNSGSITTSANNQIIENKNITGTVLINHSGVIVRKCKITHAWGQNGIEHGNAAAANMLVEDCEITAQPYAPNGWGYNGIDAEFGGTIRRCNIYGQENCVFYSNPAYGGLIEDCYLHDSYPYSLWDGVTGGGDGPHVDTFQVWAGMNGLTVRHNTIFADLQASSCITWGSNNSNVLVENNLIRGGFYTFRIGEAGNCGTNIIIRNNKFSQALSAKVGGAGLWSVGSNSGRSGNTFYESGLPVPDSL